MRDTLTVTLKTTTSIQESILSVLKTSANAFDTQFKIVIKVETTRVYVTVVFFVTVIYFVTQTKS